MRKLFRSLQAKYMLIIILAIVIVQFAYLFSALLMTGLQKQVDNSDQMNYLAIENSWHKDVNQIVEPSVDTLQQLFQQWSVRYPEGAMYWINEQGTLITSWNISDDIPTQWTSAYTASFMKERYGNEPYTVVAFVGGEPSNGFAVVEIPRSVINAKLVDLYDEYGEWLFTGVAVIILLFILISYLFFRKIRKRLLHLQNAMSMRNADGLPVPIAISKSDEIGQLENAFNQMVVELRDSREREQEEEKLRRELIANLSHDLRTPLTKVRAHTYTISKSAVAEDDKKAVKALEKSVEQMDSLIENLMSYTLLMTHKYRMELKNTDVIRFLREHIASWYSVLEKAELEIDVELEGMKETMWRVDPIWLGRILDNLFQNVIRHASSGRYIGIKVEAREQVDVIMIIDHGAGLESDSQEKGAGIGLSIVDMMIKGQNLTWFTRSNEEGLTVEIHRTRT